MKKVYAMPGVANSQIVLTSPSGKTKYKISFTGGITHAREKVPAKHITDSPIIQDVIESSPLFNKKIFLLNSFGTVVKPAAAAAAPASTGGKKPVVTTKGSGKGTGAQSGKGKGKDANPDEGQPTGPKVYEEVTSLGEAITVLMQISAVPAENMTSIEGVLKSAAELGVSFPNLVND